MTTLLASGLCRLARGLLGPLQHDYELATAKFSPNGWLVATVTWGHDIQVYNSQSGGLLVSFLVNVGSDVNQSLAWASDSNKLFALSKNGYIHHVDVSAKTTLSKWPIHSTSANSSVSFWDTTTRDQIGSVIEYTHPVFFMAMSSNHDLVTSGDKKITLRALCNVLPSDYLANTPIMRETIQKVSNQLAGSEENLIKSLRAQEESPNSKIADLKKTVQELCNELAKSQRAANEQKDSLSEQETSSNQKIATLNKVVHELHNEKGSLNETISSLCADLRTCDDSSNALLVQLADAQHKADGLIRINRAHEQKHQCESLYAQGHIRNAAECLLKIVNTTDDDVRENKFITDWLSNFTHRCVTTLERVGDEASNAGKQEEAVAAYSTALSLSPLTLNTVLMKWASVMLIHDSADETLRAALKFEIPRFVVYRAICDVLERGGRLTEAAECFRQLQNALPEDMAVDDERGEWERDFRGRCIEKLGKLGDTASNSKMHDEAIGYYSSALSLDPTNASDILLKRSSEVIELDPSSHRGYEGKHTAFHGMGRYDEAFETFRTMLSKLEQSPNLQIRGLGNNYVDATAAIQQEQAAAFEELPVYDELRSSMTTRLDCARIRREVKKFYRYVMFSHRWQPNEPTFQQVEKMSIYKLPCVSSIQQTAKFLQACAYSLLRVGMERHLLRWYRGSSLTVVHLFGVFSQSQKKGYLWKSIWNTRGWTYQEYVASKVVQFYTEDWKPYLGLDIFNHKESPIILSEMEQAMDFATQELATLQPGLERAREKLYLASRRKTTREEDMAYSLFGIFNIAIPIIYGEGNQAVGRLLEYILTRSDNVTLLTWTGRCSSSQHSYLPTDLTVYNEIVPPHVPSPMETAEMDGMRCTERLYHLPPLSLVAGRLRLPGIVFPLADVSPVSESDLDSDLPAELSGKEGLLLVHPWISPLLDQEFSCGASRFDHTTRALRLLVRLRQPFGALLLAPLGRVQYRRVATDSLIMVRIREQASSTELTNGIRTIDIQ
ncbi:hypothetical protein HD554DRAFT_2168897 [Boletus coccyginus]|nr:hypothetical protein HD554DRAFT_2168897 [Boletus coccyginus]